VTFLSLQEDDLGLMNIWPLKLVQVNNQNFVSVVNGNLWCDEKDIITLECTEEQKETLKSVWIQKVSLDKLSSSLFFNQVPLFFAGQPQAERHLQTTAADCLPIQSGNCGIATPRSSSPRPCPSPTWQKEEILGDEHWHASLLTVLLIFLEYWCAAHEKEGCSTIHLVTTVDTFLCYGTLIPSGKLNWHFLNSQGSSLWSTHKRKVQVQQERGSTTALILDNWKPFWSA
jgi:hypothetical protein